MTACSMGRRSVGAVTGGFAYSPQAKVIERFTRKSKDMFLYEFTVEDPTLYTQPWKGEMSFTTSQEPLYEYACHEGNIGLYGILAGARGPDCDFHWGLRVR